MRPFVRIGRTLENNMDMDRTLENNIDMDCTLENNIDMDLHWRVILIWTYIGE
jgi:hypothetical protein